MGALFFCYINFAKNNEIATKKKLAAKKEAGELAGDPVTDPVTGAARVVEGTTAVVVMTGGVKTALMMWTDPKVAPSLKGISVKLKVTPFTRGLVATLLKVTVLGGERVG